MPNGARFCPNCGTSQASGDEERRVVSALFADLVGFTTLSEHLDPEEVKHLIDRCFDRLAADITDFGGVVDKVLGDGIVALFGAPVAHEDDAERAVRAGLKMQQSLTALSNDLDVSIEMRIGINTGEVLVGSSAAGGDYTAMGDVMNAASRLETAAEPGQVLVGAPTHAATTDAISYHHVGSVAVRGRDEIDAWAALSAVRPPGFRTRRSSAFIGRDNELDLLLSQAQLAFETSRAQAALIIGEAGVGKSRIVEEVTGLLSAKFEARVLVGRTVPYGEANVWWPIAELVRRAFNLPGDLPRDEAEINIGTSLTAHFEGETGREPPEIERYTTALLHALGYDTELRGGDRLRNRGEVTLAMTRVLQRELQQRPVVLALADIHWAAEAVLGLITRLFEDLNRYPLLVVMTARPLEMPDFIDGRQGSLIMQLGPLSYEAGRDLVAEMAVGLPDEVIDELVERSGGNPLFLEELSNLFASDATPDGTDVAAEFDSGRLDLLPDTLRGIVSARLDALEPRVRTTIEAASVLGISGQVVALERLVQEVYGWSSVGDELAALDAAELLRVVDARFVFSSNVIRDVAYGTLTKTSRANMHSGIAGFLEAQVAGGRARNSTAVAIATHAHAAALLVNELSDGGGEDVADVNARALRWLDEAGNRALDAGEPGEAERWFGNGLGLAADPIAKSAFRYGRAKARSEIRDLAGARADLDRLEPHLSHDDHLAAKALLVRGDVDTKAGDLEIAASRLREAADRLQLLGDPEEQSLALRLLGTTQAFRGDHQLAHQALVASRQVSASAGDRRGEGWAVQTLAWFWLRSGQINEADALAQEAGQIFSELDDRGGLTLTRGLEAWVAFHRGDRDKARSLMTGILPEIRRRGDPWIEAVALNLLGSVELWSGRAGLALDLALENAAVADDAEDLGLSVDAKLLAGRAMVSRGNVLDGTVALEEAFSDADDADDAEARRRAVTVNTASAARLGEAERAIRWAARYDGEHDDVSVVGEPDLVVSLALALLQRGALAEASSQLAWLDDIDDPSNNHEFSTSGSSGFAMAVKAVIAASESRHADALLWVARVDEGPSTYLDRTLAQLAGVAVHFQAGDEEQVTAGLGRARALVSSTDDRITPLLVELVAALCGRGDGRAAEAVLASRGIDPTGWTRLWTGAVRPSGQPSAAGGR